MHDFSSRNQETPQNFPLKKMGDALSEFRNGLDSTQFPKFIIELTSLMEGIRASLKSAPENQESSDQIDEIIMNLRTIFDSPHFKRMIESKVLTLEALYNEVTDVLNDFRGRCTHAIIIKKMMADMK